MPITTASICINVAPIIRIELFDAWIGGSTGNIVVLFWRYLTVEEQALLIWQGPAYAAAPHDKTSPENAVVQSQYRLFDSIESCLRRPKYFMSQQVYFPLSPSLKISLIERYCLVRLLLTSDKDISPWTSPSPAS